MVCTFLFWLIKISLVKKLFIFTIDNSPFTIPNMSIIQIENLKKAYDTNYVLKGINLNIEAGQIVGYIGPNGAGKSTTIKILCGITSDFEGEVSVMGIDVRNNPIEVKQKIGYIP